MANDRHMGLVQQGREAFNAYRENHPEEKIDLSEADLRGMCLKEINFTSANLTKTDLRQACLVEADLTEANLTGADLRGAKIYNTIFEGAELGGAKLHGARGQSSACFAGANLMENTTLFGHLSTEDEELNIIY